VNVPEVYQDIGKRSKINVSR